MTSAKRLGDRNNTSENPHQSAPIRIASSRPRSQNIWAEVLRCWCVFLLLTLQNTICPRAGPRGGGCASNPR
jgi:hypothetical protein